jgi:hypothetical protein
LSQTKIQVFDRVATMERNEGSAIQEARAPAFGSAKANNVFDGSHRAGPGHTYASGVERADESYPDSDESPEVEQDDLMQA